MIPCSHNIRSSHNKNNDIQQNIYNNNSDYNN